MIIFNCWFFQVRSLPTCFHRSLLSLCLRATASGTSILYYLRRLAQPFHRQFSIIFLPIQTPKTIKVRRSLRKGRLHLVTNQSSMSEPKIFLSAKIKVVPLNKHTQNGLFTRLAVVKTSEHLHSSLGKFQHCHPFSRYLNFTALQILQKYFH